MIKGTWKLGRALPFVWLCIFLLYLSLLKSDWTPEWDSAYFIETSRSFISGEGFTYLGFPAIKAPIGFPLLLAPIILLGGPTFLMMNVLLIVLALGSIAVAYFLFRQHFTRNYSALIVFLSAISYLLVERTIYIMSDIPFLFFFLLTLFYLNRFLASSFSYKNGIAAGLLLIASFSIRYSGMGIFAGFLLYSLLAKNIRFRMKKIATISLIGGLGFIALNLNQLNQSKLPNDQIRQLQEFIPNQKEYLRTEWDEPLSERINLQGMILRIVKNTMYYASEGGAQIWGVRLRLTMEELSSLNKHIEVLPLLLLIGFTALIILIGFLLSLLSKNNLFDYCVLCLVGIQLLISAREPRYILSILPFIFYYFFHGASAIYSKLGWPKQKRTVLVIASFFFVVIIGSHLLRDIRLIESIHQIPSYSLENDATDTKNFMNAINWIKNNTPKECKLISVQAPWVVLLAERWCVSFPFVDKPNIIIDFLKSVNADYLVVAPLLQNRHMLILPIIDGHPDLFRDEFRSGDARVLFINKNKFEGSSISP